MPEKAVLLDQERPEEELQIYEEYIFKVSHVSNMVSKEINTSIKYGLELRTTFSSQNLKGEYSVLSPEIVQTILSADYKDNQYSYTIYILTPQIDSNHTYRVINDPAIQ